LSFAPRVTAAAAALLKALTIAPAGAEAAAGAAAAAVDPWEAGKLTSMLLPLLFAPLLPLKMLQPLILCELLSTSASLLRLATALLLALLLPMLLLPVPRPAQCGLRWNLGSFLPMLLIRLGIGIPRGAAAAVAAAAAAGDMVELASQLDLAELDVVSFALTADTAAASNAASAAARAAARDGRSGVEAEPRNRAAFA
jgi:hypothetical protein